MDRHEVLAACEAAGVRLVRFLYCDNGSLIRGKVVPIDRLEERMAGGQGLTVAMQAMNMLDELQPIDGMGPVGEVRLVPDPDSFVVVPYAPRTAAMTCDLVALDRAPWGACPRSFLRRMVDRLAERDLTVQAAFEGELTVFRRDGTAAGGLAPIDTGVCFSSVSMTAAAAYVDALVAAFDAQGIEVDAYYPELGHGQHELPLRHAPALRAADNQVWFRETVRGVAAGLDLVASVAPKPMLDQAGNGSHLHWSLWSADGSRNVGHDPSLPYGLSAIGRHVAAGVLAHLPALLALTAPTVNSFRRLQPRFWSSAYVSWGPDNREASVRVVSGRWDDEEASANLELKACDASSNPYLALGGVLAAGLDGLDRGLELDDPVLVDPATLSEDERRDRGLARYPTTADAAFDALEADPVLLDALGPDLARSYIAVKRSEAASFAAGGDELELAHFREKL